MAMYVNNGRADAEQLALLGSADICGLGDMCVRHAYTYIQYIHVFGVGKDKAFEFFL